MLEYLASPLSLHAIGDPPYVRVSWFPNADIYPPQQRCITNPEIRLVPPAIRSTAEALLSLRDAFAGASSHCSHPAGSCATLAESPNRLPCPHSDCR